jgi:hypothetical protein
MTALEVIGPLQDGGQNKGADMVPLPSLEQVREYIVSFRQACVRLARRA